jgi:cAMP-dependent protein kinase regulator
LSTIIDPPKPIPKEDTNDKMSLSGQDGFVKSIISPIATRATLIGMVPPPPPSPFSSPLASRGSVISLNSAVRLKSPALRHPAVRRATRKSHNAQNVQAKLMLFDSLDEITSPIIFKDPEAHALIKNTLLKSFIFKNLTFCEMEELIDAFYPVKYEKNDTIIEQGGNYDHFYIVSQGLVEYQVNGQKVGTGGPGEFFGELALLYDCPRAATVLASTITTHLFQVDQKTMRFILQAQTKKSEETKMALIEGVDLFNQLTATDKKKLCASLRPRLFKRGDVIAKPKSAGGQAFFIVQVGELKVTDQDNGAKTHLKAGDYFGEKALLDNQMLNVTIKGLQNGTIFYIKGDTFEKIVGKYSELVTKDKTSQWLVRISLFLLVVGNA